MEHLGKRAAPLPSGGHMIAVLMREFMSFMFLNIHQTPPWGDHHEHWRECGSVMNGSPL